MSSYQRVASKRGRIQFELTGVANFHTSVRWFSQRTTASKIKVWRKTGEIMHKKQSTNNTRTNNSLQTLHKNYTLCNVKPSKHFGWSQVLCYLLFANVSCFAKVSIFHVFFPWRPMTNISRFLRTETWCQGRQIEESLLKGRLHYICI